MIPSKAEKDENRSISEIKFQTQFLSNATTSPDIKSYLKLASKESKRLPLPVVSVLGNDE